MVEVSNRALAYIMVAAMFITVLSTTATLTRLDMVQTEMALTGFATSPNATARLNVSGATSIVFRTATIDWGTGFVNNSPTCNLTTSGIPGHRSGCGNFTDLGQPGPLVLENDGNQIVNVTLQLNMTAETWIGTGAVALANATENSTNVGTACTVGLLTTLTSVSTTPLTICENFDYADDEDTLDIGLKVELPSSSPPGEKTVSIIATATSI